MWEDASLQPIGESRRVEFGVRVQLADRTEYLGETADNDLGKEQLKEVSIVMRIWSLGGICRTYREEYLDWSQRHQG